MATILIKKQASASKKARADPNMSPPTTSRAPARQRSGFHGLQLFNDLWPVFCHYEVFYYEPYQFGGNARDAGRLRLRHHAEGAGQGGLNMPCATLGFAGMD